MNKIIKKSKWALLLCALIGCSILPEQHYIPVSRYDFGKNIAHYQQNSIRLSDVHVILHGPHPHKWSYRTEPYKIQQMEYLRWSPALDELIQAYIHSTVGTMSQIKPLQITVYKWEYDSAQNNVVAEYSVVSLRGNRGGHKYRTTVAVAPKSQPLEIAKGFSQLIKKVSTQIKKEPPF